MNSIDSVSNCPNDTFLQQALEAYIGYLSTNVNGKEKSCSTPCQHSLVRPKTYFTMPFVPSRCIEISEYPVTLRMPTTILLTESTFSYPFMTFASELGGKTKKYFVYFTFPKDIIC
jgi:hypothetical protein